VNAGSGALSVTVEGPSKVQLNCSEVDDGYEFSYLPTVPGDYNIAIKYGGNFHIVGSPFTAHITGTGLPLTTAFEASNMVVDATHKLGTAPARLLVQNESYHPERVTCGGLGLKRAIHGRASQFTVDASAGGNSMLTIGIIGPTGASYDELNVKHAGKQQYNVTYTLKDKGQYTMWIKWGDQHVPNSPFVIDVV
jgi:filamin